MSNYAVVVGGKVVNIVVWNGDETIWQPPLGGQVVSISSSDKVDIGDAYSGSTFSSTSSSE
ncbi:hypothetical protein DIE09_06710 [Burkholderia sp. Bp9010]|nr:hypothetical protein DIE10_06535 [Burkholderia sp. Bp9011]RQR97080.1 hypothetical protein DIE09_06710 [Burkholderia sp. Bp9010]